MSIHVECSFGVSERLIEKFVTELLELQGIHFFVKEIELNISEPILNEFKTRITLFVDRKSIVCYASGDNELCIKRNSFHSIKYGLLDYYEEMNQRQHTGIVA